MRTSAGSVVLLLLLSSFVVPLAQAAPSARLWAMWDSADATSPASIDHGAWQQFLDAHLQVYDDNINRNDYAGLPGSARTTLQAYIASLVALDPRTYNRDEQMAYWINLYNALTVDVVLRYPGKDSIMRMSKKIFSVGPWNDEVARVAGEAVTLNDIEHRILRPIFRDHRIHYAVNCASLGCPNLAKNAFTGENLQSQLDAAEVDFLNHPRAVSFDDNGELRLSQIYQWYLVDFGRDERDLLAHLAERHDTLAARLRGYSGDVSYEYNWDLNTAL